jgi:hypothetical protein
MKVSLLIHSAAGRESKVFPVCYHVVFVAHGFLMMLFHKLRNFHVDIKWFVFAERNEKEHRVPVLLL